MSGMSAGLREVRRKLQLAARSLVPVVIDQGPFQAKLGSYVDALEDEGDRQWLRLFPIAAAAIAPEDRLSGGVRVYSVDAQVPWVLSAHRIEPMGGRAARVLVDVRSRLEPLPPRTQARVNGPGCEALVLVAAMATDDRDLHVFPVLGLGATHCMIESTVPLEPGIRIDPVELRGDRRILRRAAATVLDAIPWCSPQGNRLFRCRLSLGDVQADPARSSRDLIAQPRRIKRYLDLAAMMQRPGWLTGQGKMLGSVRLAAVGTDDMRVTLADLESEAALPPQVTVGFELFGSSYELDVRVVQQTGLQVTLSLPLLLRRRRWRREKRAETKLMEPLTVLFHNPAMGITVRRPLRDLSFGGLCFEANLKTDILWRNLPLENVTVEWRGQGVSLGDMEVRGVQGSKRALVHVAGRNDRGTADTAFINLLAALRNPDIAMHEGADFRTMLDLYRRAGLVADFMLRNIESVAPMVSATWRRMHQPKADVACTLVHPQTGTPQSTFSGVRAWERTWLAQHFGASATSFGQASGAVHVAYFDYVLPRDDAHHIVFFIKADNTGTNTFQQRFLEVAGTPESVARVKVNYWMKQGSDGVTDQSVIEPGSTPCRIRPMRRGDERLVARAAERMLGEEPARALSMVEGEFKLPNARKAFRAAGLLRGRRIELVTKDGTAAMALFQEETSPGVNLTWMLNACWLLPICPQLDADRTVTRAAVDRILSQPSSTPTGDRFVITVDETDVSVLEEAGFERLADVWLYALNRSGLYRYSEYIADRYGEVGALTMRRKEARVAMQEVG